VDLFFALSAFLITELLFKEHQATGSIATGRFYLRRLLRIWPLYFAYLGAWSALAWTFLPDGSVPTVDVSLYTVFLGNWGMMLHGPSLVSIDHLWSVSIEEQFYLVWPVLLRVVRPARWALLFMVCVGVALGTRYYMALRGGDVFDFQNNTLGRLDVIACGALTSIGLRTRPLRLGGAGRLALFCTGILGFVLLVHAFGTAPGGSVAQAVFLQLGVCGCCVTLLVSSVGARSGVLGKFLCHAWIVYLGRISYGLYILHVVCIDAAETLWMRAFGSAHPEGWRIPALLLTIFAGAVSYRFLESPFLRMKDRFAVVASRPT
jgi:peptidoglycan/LPS O-acetylase OafA/YrhL